MVRGLSDDEARYLDTQLHALFGNSRIVNAPFFTLERLLERWRRFVTEVAGDFTDGIDDYTIEVWHRNQIEDLVREAPPALRDRLIRAVQPWDDRYYAATTPTGFPLFPYSQEPSEEAWWYRLPRRLNPKLGQWVLERRLSPQQPNPELARWVSEHHLFLLPNKESDLPVVPTLSYTARDRIADLEVAQRRRPFPSLEQLVRQFERHGFAMGFLSELEYLQSAQGLVEGDRDRSVARSPEGRSLFYGHAGNEFAALEPDGVHLATYFGPVMGLLFWRDQSERGRPDGQ